MAATRDQIDKWFDEGVSSGKHYMVVLCDTYDWVDYPAFFDTEGSARAKMRNPGTMQRVMECYDLAGNKSEQMTLHRAMALDV